MFSKEEITRLEEISKMPADKRQAAVNEFLKKLKPEQIEQLKKQQTCIFCGIANKQVKTSIVYEDKESMAVMDINPVRPGHVLLFPRKHTNLLDNKFEEMVKKLSLAAIKAVNGNDIEIKTSENAGQKDAHIALHLIPRFKDNNNEDAARKESPEDIAKKIVSNLLKKTEDKNIFIKNVHEKSLPREEKVENKIEHDSGLEAWLEERIP